MPIKYTIDPVLKLLCTVFYDVVNRTDALKYVAGLSNEPKFNYCENSLIVLKESRLMYNLEDIEEFSRAMVKLPNVKFRKKIAILIESPSDTVAATIYAQNVLTLRKEISIELFYTVEAALNFLKLSDYKCTVEGLIHKVPNTNRAKPERFKSFLI